MEDCSLCVFPSLSVLHQAAGAAAATYHTPHVCVDLCICFSICVPPAICHLCPPLEPQGREGVGRWDKRPVTERRSLRSAETGGRAAPHQELEVGLQMKNTSALWDFTHHIYKTALCWTGNRATVGSLTPDLTQFVRQTMVVILIRLLHFICIAFYIASALHIEQLKMHYIKNTLQDHT